MRVQQSEQMLTDEMKQMNQQVDQLKVEILEAEGLC